MKTQKERLLEFLEASGYSIREFERLIGVSNATVNHINDTLSANLKEKISTKFQQLNMDWLLHGTGEMLNQNIQVSVGDPSNGDGSMQNVSGSHNSVGLPQKKFIHEAEWFALVAEKDKQISRLLTIIEKMQDK